MTEKKRSTRASLLLMANMWGLSACCILWGILQLRKSESDGWGGITLGVLSVVAAVVSTKQYRKSRQDKGT